MAISDRLLAYFNRRKTQSTDKDHTRFRHDICNHWDLDYLSMEELEQRLLEKKTQTTFARKKKDNQGPSIGGPNYVSRGSYLKFDDQLASISAAKEHV